MVDKKKKRLRKRFERQQAYQSLTIETKNQTEKGDFNLPHEIWCMIFSYLPFKSKKNATATCKLWFRLIRGNQKFSGYILISWHTMEKAIDKLQWNWDWNNWPALKTLELKSHPLAIVGDSRETIQCAIEKLSLKDSPKSLEEVLFDVDLTLLKTHGWSRSLLKYQLSTDHVLGLGQKLDSMEKWKEYELNMKALKTLNSMGRGFKADGTDHGLLAASILAKMVDVSTSNDLLLLIASKDFRNLCDIIDYVYVVQLGPHSSLEYDCSCSECTGKVIDVGSDRFGNPIFQLAPYNFSPFGGSYSDSLRSWGNVKHDWKCRCPMCDFPNFKMSLN